MAEVMREAGLAPLPAQLRKGLELYEQLRQRTGVVVVGPSGAGKSTLWKLLRLALLKIGQQVKHYVLNPKSMPRNQVCRLACFQLNFSSYSKASCSITRNV